MTAKDSNIVADYYVIKVGNYYVQKSDGMTLQPASVQLDCVLPDHGFAKGDAHKIAERVNGKVLHVKKVIEDE